MRKPLRGLSAVTYCSDFSRETIKSDVRVETEQGVTASGPRGIFFSQCFSLTSPHLFISNFLSPPPKWTDK